MNLIGNTILFLQFVACTFYCAGDILAGHHQLLVVTTEDWDHLQGCLQLYERKDDHSEWLLKEQGIPVVVGKTGLAWGIGLHSRTNQVPTKAEGDSKSPAGIFSLGTAFGFASPVEMAQLKIDYLPLHDHIEAVDDPLSQYYNCIVDHRVVSVDWSSSEKMNAVSLYKIGMVVNHNYPNPQPGAGSAIFLHIWRNEHTGTAGCTAMSEQHLNRVLFWIDNSKNPVLVQLPIDIYREIQQEWNLPLQ